MKIPEWNKSSLDNHIPQDNLSAANHIDSHLANFLEILDEPLFVMDLDCRILSPNGSFTENYTPGSGTSPSPDIHNQHFRNFHPNIFAETVKRENMVEEALRTGKPVSRKVVQHNRSWTYTIYPIRTTGDSFTHFLLVVQDKNIGSNNLAAISALYDNVPASILVIDANMRLIGWNRFSRDIINGLPDDKMSGINPFNRVHPDDVSDLVDRMFFNVMNFDTEETAEFRMFHRDGPPYKWATVRAKKAFIEGQACMVAVVTEISELKHAEETQKQLQEQLQHYQKMELIGQLAGGMAHDFNNALAAIIGNTELVLKKLDPACSFTDNIKDILHIATHSASLTQQLLAFARKQLIQPTAIDLNDAVTKYLPILHRLNGENIHIEWCPCENPAFVLIDVTQLEQILSNLFINARDAINDNGKIFIHCTSAHFDNADCTDSRLALSPGDYFRLSIGDTGSGIETKLLPHIYEPFFTTKEVGKGTGLGLSTVYGIVRQNNGHIECRTELGKGTIFDIYLPHHNKFEPNKESKAIENNMLNAGQTVLVVEDEPYILKLIKDILEIHDFTVFTAQDAEECIDIAGKYKSGIDLVVTDIVLPKMNGIELSSLLMKDNPSLKVLFMSAYTPENISQDKRLQEGVDFIQKPFGISDLIQMVNKVLSSS
ncbi:MAG TPA: response regulator [Chlorobaculum sp.]|nr:response regulator [Chlorobaculum sp.]